MRLAGRAADVDPVRPRPSHDGQAAGALGAAARRAGVAEQRVAHAAAGHGARQGCGRDQLVALAVGEDEDGAPVTSDQRPGLRRRADGDLIGRTGRMRVQEVRQRRHARGRHLPRAPRRLGAVTHGGQRRGQGDHEHHAQQRDRGDVRAPWASPHREGDPRPQARGHRRIQAGQVARAQARHGAAQRQAGDEP